MNKLIATLIASLFALTAFAADTPAKTAAPVAAADAPAKPAKHKGAHHHKKVAPKAAETK